MSEHTHRMSRRAFLGGAAAFGAVSLANPTLAFATPTAAEKQAEADAVRVQVTAMQEELDKASDDYYTAIEAHEAAVALMEETQVKIDDTNAQIGEVQDSLGTRARSMYRSGGSSFLDILLGSTSFEEFATNWELLNRMNENDADMVQQSKDLRSDLETQKAEYEEQEKIAAEKEAEALQIKETAEATVVELTSVMESLDEEARVLLEEEQRIAAEAAAAAERARLEAEAAAAASQNNSGGGGNGGGGGSSNGGGGGSNGGGSINGNGQDIPTNGSVVDYAISRLGCPYVWGATGPDTFDCSGLTSWCYRQVGKEITRTTYTQINAAKQIMAVSDAQPGDVLHRSSHVGIATEPGGGTYIHAPHTGDVVKYSTGSSFNCALRF